MSIVPEIAPYLPDERKWIVKPVDKFMGNMEDLGLMYSMWVTPQMPSEPDYCIFMCSVIKEAKNSLNGLVLECEITYGYKIKGIGKQLSPELLFGLQLNSYNVFKKEYEKRTKNTHVAHYMLDAPTFPEYKNTLEIALMQIGIGRN